MGNAERGMGNVSAGSSLVVHFRIPQFAFRI